MNNPVLLVKDAGYGETPPCHSAVFQPGDVVRWNKGSDYIVAVAVPPRFPADYALADLTKTPRPLMISKPSIAITYILVRENDPQPYLAKEKAMRPSGKPRVDIGSILYAEAPADGEPPNHRSQRHDAV